MAESGSNQLGKKLLFTLGALGAGAAWAIASLAEKANDKRKKKGRKGDMRSSNEEEKWSNYEPWNEISNSANKRDAVTIDHLQALTFQETAEYAPNKRPKGFQPHLYTDRTAAVGSFSLLHDPELAYYLFEFCSLHEIVLLRGVCKTWNSFLEPLLNDREYLKVCAYRGFTSRSHIRGHCWKHLVNAPRVTEKKVKMYYKLSEQVGKQHGEIGRDGDRTLIHHASFVDDDEAVRVLTRLLRAYAIHDPGVGYTQGMNFLAGFLLTQLVEEEAYWLLYHLLISPKLKIRNLFTDGLPSLKLAQYQFQRLLEWFLPRLADHFHKHHITTDLYITEWVMTLFTYKHIPPETSARIWDIFLLDGWKFLFRIGLAILSLAQPALLSLEFEGMVQYLKFYPDQAIFVPEILLNKAHTFKITNRLLHRLALQFHEEFVVVKENERL